MNNQLKQAEFGGFGLPYSNSTIKEKIEEEEKIINTIKLFMVHGAKVFYLNYMMCGEEFIKKECVDDIKIKKVLKSTRNAEVQYELKLIGRKEFIAQKVRRQILTDILKYESDTSDTSPLITFRHISACITGNIGSMFDIVKQFIEFKKVNCKTIQLAERHVYFGILGLLVSCESLKKYVA